MTTIGGRRCCSCWIVLVGYYAICSLLFQHAHAAFLQIGEVGFHRRRPCYEWAHRDEDASPTAASPISASDVTGPIPANPLNVDASIPMISRSAFLASLILAVPAATLAMTSSEDNTRRSIPVAAASRSRTTLRHDMDSTTASNSILLSNGSSSSSSKKEQVLAESLSGSVAGAALTITKTLVKFPLDTATVRLQMPSQEYSIFRVAELFTDCYRGVWTPLLANIPAGAVFFAVKDAVVQSIDNDDNDSKPSWLTTSVAVAAAQIPYWPRRDNKLVLPDIAKVSVRCKHISKFGKMPLPPKM
jgi:Mitochondrial carrier protein